jgi:hypothetical protein
MGHRVPCLPLWEGETKGGGLHKALIVFSAGFRASAASFFPIPATMDATELLANTLSPGPSLPSPYAHRSPFYRRRQHASGCHPKARDRLHRELRACCPSSRCPRLTPPQPEYMLMLSSVLVNEATPLHVRNAAGLALKNALSARVRAPFPAPPTHSPPTRRPHDRQSTARGGSPSPTK